MINQNTLEWMKCAKDPVYFLNTYGSVFDIRKQQIDKLECFPYQEDALKQYEKFKNNFEIISQEIFNQGKQIFQLSSVTALRLSAIINFSAAKSISISIPPLSI